MRRRLVGWGLVLACLVSACAGEEGGPTTARVPKASNPPTSGISGNLGGASEPTPEPTSSPDHAAVVLGITPGSVSLVPPSLDGGTPLYPTSIQLSASRDGQPATPRWESSDARIAEVDAQGLVSALRAGAVTITARLEGLEATTTVTVEARGRLLVTATNPPPGTWRVITRVLDSSGALLAQGTGPFDLVSAGSLTVEAEARSVQDTILGLGRWEGVSIQANQVNERVVSLNVPQLTSNSGNGGPGSTIILRGSGFESWQKGQGGSNTAWIPTLSATVGGQTAGVSALSDTMASLTVPNLSGSPASRSLTLVVGGVPLTSSFRLLGALQIASPPATMSVGEVVCFEATATDIDGVAVTRPNVTWGLLGGDMGEPALGMMDPGGSFEAERPGSATIVARSGALFATTPITVVP